MARNIFGDYTSEQRRSAVFLRPITEAHENVAEVGNSGSNIPMPMIFSG
jgi:hypothetical protein